ncbi:MAG: site-specific integrase [Bradyrhizobiaceae bacterium]|nr:site-specific integrase [Bradyrhizobiaceae bacterium]
MRLSFYLDKPNAATSVVLLNVAFRGHRLRFGTGISLPPQHWNKDRQEPRASDPHRNAHLKQLSAISTEVHRVFNSLGFGEGRELVTPETIREFKDRIHDFIDPQARVQSTRGLIHDFTEFINTYTLRSSTGLVSSKRPGKRSLQNYRLVQQSLVEYGRGRRVKVEYDTITLDFYTNYCQWLSESRGLVDASISNYIKVLKTFMKWSRDQGYHTNLVYERFYRDKRTAQSMALSVDELRLIRDLDLSDDPRLARVRDHFLLQAYTGMRYGDLETLAPIHFDDAAGVIRLTTKKTDAVCLIPITRPLALLLERYPSRIFEFASSVKQNLYLKDIGLRAGLTKSMTTHAYRMGKREDVVKPRFELLSTHVARRTFVTTSVRFGIPESVISVVTGHSAKGMLQQHYINLDEESVRDIVIKAWDQL